MAYSYSKLCKNSTLLLQLFFTQWNVGWLCEDCHTCSKTVKPQLPKLQLIELWKWWFFANSLLNKNFFFCYYKASRHAVVCCAPQEAGVSHHEYIEQEGKRHIAPWSRNQFCFKDAFQIGNPTYQIWRKFPKMQDLKVLSFFFSSYSSSFHTNVYSDWAKTWHTYRAHTKRISVPTLFGVQWILM